MTDKRIAIIPPATQAMYDTYHFAPATRVGNLIWVSGQVGLGADMRPADGIEAQARMAFSAVQGILAAAGATLADVVELTTFHTALQQDIETFAKVKDEFFPDRYPSWTAVGLSELALPGLCVEIRAVAVRGSGTL